jgi:hypothetical protein
MGLAPSTDALIAGGLSAYLPEVVGSLMSGVGIETPLLFFCSPDRRGLETPAPEEDGRDGEMFPELLWWEAMASGWEMHVWDCRGLIRPKSHLWEELDFVNRFKYIEVGKFKVPIPEEFAGRLTDKALRKIEGWCWEVLRFWDSGINISGIYPIPIHMLQELEAILYKYSKPSVEEPDLSLIMRP